MIYTMIRKQIYLPEKQIEDVERLAEAEGLSFSEMLRRIISEHLKREAGS